MRFASAEVRKEFFIDMFTRDISLEDCVLDLIDNSVDSYLLKNKISVSNLIFDQNNDNSPQRLGTIDVTCSERQVKVVDTCGGISRKRALEDVFCFGHEKDEPSGKLGAYGVGMKRALFKIGNKFDIVSQTATEGFVVSFKLNEWAERPEWKIPISFIDGASSEAKAGTTVTITELRSEVALRIKQGDVPANIIDDAALTYPFFLDKCVRLKINGTAVAPKPVPLGHSEGTIQPAHESFQHEDVKVELVATVAPGQRTSEQAGWNVLCNGRAVVSADKGRLTGWGAELPTFHSKYTSFVGLASFESSNPLSLPWTTTKRDINQESSVFIRAKASMAAMSKPILNFLNKQYPTDPRVEAGDIRDAVEGVRPIAFREIVSKPVRGFEYTPPKRKEKKTEWVRFQASIASLDKVRRHLRRSSLSPSDIGKHTFEHFLKTECAAD